MSGGTTGSLNERGALTVSNSGIFYGVRRLAVVTTLHCSELPGKNLRILLRKYWTCIKRFNIFVFRSLYVKVILFVSVGDIELNKINL